MRIRKIPLRGERYLSEGVEVVVIDGSKLMVTVIWPNGKAGAVSKETLNLPVIDTKDYEKLPQK